MVQFGPDFDLATRLKRVEDWIARQNANPLGQAFSATQSDGSVGIQIGQDAGGATALVFHQGPSTSRDANTDQHATFAYLGQIYSNGQLEDAGALFYRPGGQQSGVIGNRGWQMFDAKGNQVFATDEYNSTPSNEGLRNPQLTLPLPQATGTGAWPKTNSTTAGSIARCYFTAQHAQVWWTAQFYADSGTNGTVELQLTSPDGNTTVTGTQYTVTGGQFGSANNQLTLPAGFWHQVWTVNVQAQVTAGTGYVYCQTLSLYGISTS